MFVGSPSAFWTGLFDVAGQQRVLCLGGRVLRTGMRDCSWARQSFPLCVLPRVVPVLLGVAYPLDSFVGKSPHPFVLPAFSTSLKTVLDKSFSNCYKLTVVTEDDNEQRTD